MRGTGKKKIEIKRIEKKSSRMVTFSKRRKGLIKKAVELQDKTGARVAVVVISPGNNAYTFGDIPAMSEVVERAIAMNNNGIIVPHEHADDDHILKCKTLLECLRSERRLVT